MPQPKKKEGDNSTPKTTSTPASTDTPANNPSKVAKQEISDAKAKARAGKKAEMKGLKPAKHYDKAATSTDDFVKNEDLESDDEAELEEEEE